MKEVSNYFSSQKWLRDWENVSNINNFRKIKSSTEEESPYAIYE